MFSIGVAAVIAISLLGSIADKAGISLVFIITALLALTATLPVIAARKTKFPKTPGNILEEQL